MNQRPDLVTLTPVALVSAQRSAYLEQGISPFKCEPHVRNEKSTSKNHAVCHCVFRIIAWLSSTRSNAISLASFPHFELYLIIILETSMPCPQLIKYFSIFWNKVLLMSRMGQHCCVWPASGPGSTSNSLPSYTLWLGRLLLCASAGTANTALSTARLCLWFQHTQMHMKPRNGDSYGGICLVQQNLSLISLWGVATKPALGNYMVRDFHKTTLALNAI